MYRRGDDMPAAKTIVKIEEKDVPADQQLLSSISSVANEIKLESRAVDLLLKSLGKDFTYPAYDRLKAETAEKRVSVEHIIELLGDDADVFVAGLVLGLGSAEHWEMGKMGEAQLKEAINGLFESNEAMKMAMAMMHFMDYELRSRITEAQKSMSYMAFDDEFEAPEVDTYYMLMGLCISAKTDISKAGNRYARDMDYTDRLRRGMRNLLIVDQATEITPYEAWDYLKEATKDNRRFSEFFSKAGAEREGLKDAMRRNGGGNDPMFG